MSLLVIHPADSRTDFYKNVYQNLGIIDTVSRDSRGNMLRLQIEQHHQILCLGMGSHMGLYDGRDKLRLNHVYASLFEGKDCVFIWPGSASYRDTFRINAYACGNFITNVNELQELKVCAVSEANKKLIEDSNFWLTHAIRNCLRYAYSQKCTLKEVFSNIFVLEYTALLDTNVNYILKHNQQEL